MTDVPGLIFVTAPPAPKTYNVLLYGQPKSGKSTAAATAPGPILWLNAEGPGALGYARKTATTRGTPILEVAVDKRSKDCTRVLDEVYRHVRDAKEPAVATVVVDTLAKVRDALIAELVVKGAKNTLQQFGEVADKLGGFINALRDLPVNLVLIAHADMRDSDEDGRIVVPLIGGKLTETVPGEVDVVAFTAAHRTDEGVRYFGQLVEGKGRIAGDRSGALAGERGVRELDLSEWLECYVEALTPKVPADVPFVEREEDLGPDSPGGQFDLDEARSAA